MARWGIFFIIGLLFVAGIVQAQQPVREAPDVTEPNESQAVEPAPPDAVDPREELRQLREENQRLRIALEQLQEQLQLLGATADPATPSPLMQQALQQSAPQRQAVLPEVVLKSKAFDGEHRIAQLLIGERTILVHEGDQVTVRNENARPATIEVKQITAERVELEVVELEQTIHLY